jgi:assimilatory nitrate reductase catalytic subunit
MGAVPELGEVRTTCPYCGVGCGVLARVTADRSLAVCGDPDHPANFGRLCSKGAALGETVDLEGRLLFPQVGDRRVSWGEALNLVAAKFAAAVAKHGPDSVAFYVSGQLLTEDYYVANKLMKGFIGSANIDTNSRLCMASSVAGHRRAFGSDTVPGLYEDLELADLVVLVGSNLAWCHPVLYQRLAAAKAARPEMRVVLVDPRRTVTADIADLHLAIRPDGDTAVFAGLLAHLAQRGVIDRGFIDRHTTGFDQALEAARFTDFDKLAERAGVDHDLLLVFYTLFAATPKTVTVYSQGVNQSSVGTDKVNAIINCHLATGRIGRPGTGPFSVTGQPNAMGGREVGGLANTLAAHMEIDNEAHRQRVRQFWDAPTIASRPGLKAVDMFRAVARGRIKALWIMATNPVDSLPEGDAVETAIKNCPFVVVSDVVSATDTVRHAHVRLPAAAWAEKGGTVTNSERRISRQRPVLPPPGEARPDWWMICEVARRMGFGRAFAYTSPAEIFAEHAALSGYENHGARAFDISAFGDIGQAAYEALRPFLWPAAKSSSSDSTRFFAQGGFFTADGKARLVPVQSVAIDRLTEALPLTLNTGRVRDHWHTMTRTAKSQRLSQHFAEPYAEIHHSDARARGIAAAEIVRLRSPHATILVRALLSDRQRAGSVFVPMHWTDQFASNARVDRLVSSVTDPVSGQPASKHVAVEVERFDAKLYGFAVCAREPIGIAAAYWAAARCNGGWRIELAFAAADRDWPAFASALLGATVESETLFYRDAQGGQQRYACFAGERLVGALFLALEPVPVPRSWLVEQLANRHPARSDRFAVIAGRPRRGTVDRGATVCSCFNVGINQIAAAVAAGCHTVEAVGQAMQAGTNCGSCRAEIRGIIEACRLRAAE